MRRRLNACCKGEYSKIDPEATVGYLHRTVRDFISKPDVWAGLLDATSSTFNPYVRLAMAHASHLKILPTNSLENSILGEYASYMREAESFWGK